MSIASQCQWNLLLLCGEKRKTKNCRQCSDIVFLLLFTHHDLLDEHDFHSITHTHSPCIGRNTVSEHVKATRKTDENVSSVLKLNSFHSAIARKTFRSRKISSKNEENLWSMFTHSLSLSPVVVLIKTKNFRIFGR